MKNVKIRTMVLESVAGFLKVIIHFRNHFLLFYYLDHIDLSLFLLNYF